MTRLKELALNPWVILISLAGGLALGTYLPEWSLKMAFVGHVYLDLMKMVVLPFMLSAVILSTQRLIQEGSGGRLFGRVLLVFVIFSLTAAVIGAGTMLALRPGVDLPRETLDTFGEMVGGDLDSSNTAMELNGPDPQPPTTGLEALLLSLVPSNIFAALTNDETLKILVFSILLGVAIGQVPKNVSEGFSKSLETLYQGCQKIMQWMNYLLPVGIAGHERRTTGQDRFRTAAGHDAIPGGLHGWRHSCYCWLSWSSGSAVNCLWGPPSPRCAAPLHWRSRLATV